MKLDAFIFEHPWYMVNDYLTIVGYATRVIFCSIDLVKKAISKMKLGKAAGPSGIVVEMIKAAGDTGATMI